MQYFVAGNLNHNGHAYKRGETINLDEKTANGLIEVGVLKTEPIADTEAAHVPTPEATPAQPEVTGNPMQTGEPSLDGNGGNTDRTNDNATDVTPPVDNQPAQPEVTPSDTNTEPAQGLEVPVEPKATMSRGDLEDMARAEGVDSTKVEEARNREVLVDLIMENRDANKQAPPVEPEVDPSANL